MTDWRRATTNCDTINTFNVQLLYVIYSLDGNLNDNYLCLLCLFLAIKSLCDVFHCPPSFTIPINSSKMLLWKSSNWDTLETKWNERIWISNGKFEPNETKTQAKIIYTHSMKLMVRVRYSFIVDVVVVVLVVIVCRYRFILSFVHSFMSYSA